jgi:tetratricopeptide (TPR) repeat protein
MATGTMEGDAAKMAAQWRAKGDALHAAGDAKAGAEAHMQALAASTRDPALMAAAAALQANNLHAAERLLKDHLKRAPSDIGAIRMLAELAARLGRMNDASVLLTRALELAPQFHPARFARSLLLSRRGKPLEAIADVDDLLAIAPDNLGYLNLKASILVRLGEYEEARATYERVLADGREHPKVLMSLGHTLKTAGRTQEGIDAYRRSIAVAPTLGESWWSLANLKTFRFSAADIASMQAALATPNLSDEDRLHLHFALAKAFEDDADIAQSFEHYSQGNRLRRAQTDYSADEIHGRVERAKALFTPAFFNARRGFGSPAPDPIFIVGLPRSGSTLLEQILASHSMVEGTMELPDIDQIARRFGIGEGEEKRRPLVDLSAEECRALGEEYIERTRVQRKLGRPLFIDKMPNNWRQVGLIHLILPNAKIIDARRHPVATCFSAWKQHFARGQAFTYDFADLARYYADYVAFMAHVDAVLPGRVLRVIHERLVGDPEAEVRRVLDRLGLPFEQGCLDFHMNDRAVRTASSEQVRRPISTQGLDQWRNYETQLQPLITELTPVLDTWDEQA